MWQRSVVQAYCLVANGAVEVHMLVFVNAIFMLMAVAKFIFHACASVIYSVHKMVRAEEAERA